MESTAQINRCCLLPQLTCNVPDVNVQILVSC